MVYFISGRVTPVIIQCAMVFNNDPIKIQIMIGSNAFYKSLDKVWNSSLLENAPGITVYGYRTMTV